MNLLAPPEIADGGYWYVVPTIPDDLQGGKTPDVTFSGWCAWYGTNETMIRCTEPRPVSYLAVEPPRKVLGQAGHSAKPYGRIGGQ